MNSNFFEIVGNLVIFGNTFVVAIQAEQMPWAITEEEKPLDSLDLGRFRLNSGGFRAKSIKKQWLQ